MTTHNITLPGGFTLNRYHSSYTTPRPESFREDVTNSEGMSDEQAQIFYSNLIAGAESGEDFSTRWFSSGNDLTTISTSSFVPVDLNSILYKFEANMVYFYTILGQNPPFDYVSAMHRRRLAMDRFLWNPLTYQWHDYCITNSSQIVRAYPSNWFPIWAGAYNTSYTNQLLNALKNSGLLQIGGVLTTQMGSGQQWDSPNAWAPHQSLLVQTLLQLNTQESNMLAQTVALRFLNAIYIGYQSTQMMHEKYNAFIPGAPGSGGEYPPQIGFGWTNGVALEFLNLYG